MQANAAATTDVTRTRAKARDRSAARLSVIEAARRLAAKNGIEKLTLAAAAAEAGIARATVYGYFKNKDELLQAVVADDLTNLQEMKDGQAVVASDVIAEAAAVEDNAAVEAVTEAAVPPDAEEELVPVVETVEETPPASPLEVSTHEFRVEQKQELDNILARLTPNDPPESEGSAAAMARFDRRLRVVERTLADVQTHQQQTDKTTTVSADSLSETLRVLNQRLEESERRQREGFAELRASAREAARRLEVIEGKPLMVDMPAAVAAAPVPLTVEPVPVEAVEHVEASAPVIVDGPEMALVEDSGKPQHVDVVEAHDDEAPQPEEPKSNPTYLDAARRSARAAMETAAKPAKPRSWLYRVPRKYLVFTCAAMSVVVAAIGFLVVQRATAIAAMADTLPKHSIGKPVAAAPRRMAMATPLDQLSAMASSGNGKAQLIVGLKYLKGEAGIAKNPALAAQWIGRAAQRGEPMAQYWAGYVYQHGVGVSADPDEAMRWYEAAADQGNVKAMYNLGVGNAEGWTGAKDVPEAARWFARAARLGYVDAQFNLAVLYERGDGVPPSMMDAYKWYAVAAAQGDLESKHRLDAMATQMNADDLAAAQRSAMVFRPTPTVAEANTLPVLNSKRT